MKFIKVEAKSYEKTDNPDLVAGIDSLFIILKNKGKYAVYIDPWNEFEPSDPSSVEFSGINPELVGKEQFNSLLEVKKALLENEAIEEDAEFIDIKSGDVLVF